MLVFVVVVTQAVGVGVAMYVSSPSSPSERQGGDIAVVGASTMAPTKGLASNSPLPHEPTISVPSGPPSTAATFSPTHTTPTITLVPTTECRTHLTLESPPTIPANMYPIGTQHMTAMEILFVGNPCCTTLACTSAFCCVHVNGGPQGLDPSNVVVQAFGLNERIN